MTTPATVQRSDVLKSLSDQLARLEGGESSIDAFTTWFTKARWEDRIFSSSGLNSLMWTIDTLLLEYDIPPFTVEDDADFAADVRDAIYRLDEQFRRSQTTVWEFEISRSPKEESVLANIDMRAAGTPATKVVMSGTNRIIHPTSPQYPPSVLMTGSAPLRELVLR